MDLTLNLENNYKLNIRAGGIIIHNNKVLTHKDIRHNHYSLPGGRVEVGENSENTIKRELQEELGKQVDILGYETTIENFFEMDGKKYHEIYFTYKLEFTNEKDKKIEETLKNIEGKDHLEYHWLDLEKIDQYELLPECIKNSLKTKKFPNHIINSEID